MNKLSEEDQERLKTGAKTCWEKFTTFVDKFSELIFIVALLASCGWNIYHLFVAQDPSYTNHMFISILLCVYYIIFAAILFLSMRGHEKVLFYLGFLRGRMSKAIFLMFLACLVFPVSTDDAGSSLSTMAGAFLMVVAGLQLLKLC